MTVTGAEGLVAGDATADAGLAGDGATVVATGIAKLVTINSK